MEYRIERDSMGEMQVPADRYWAAQTQRSYQNFKIGGEVMPREITHAFGILKKAAAIANNRIKPEKMDAKKLSAISAACDEVIAGKLNDHFPLVVWQTGSGTQSNMNANEVIANRGNEIAGEKLLHPNDHVNMSQSSNDTFPTAMHIAAVLGIEDQLMPVMERFIETLKRLEAENEDVVKSGRTHLQDATPIRFSQEISGWRAMIEKPYEMLKLALSIPTRYRVSKEETKLALRGAALKCVPEKVASMPKTGFLTPLNDWLCRDEFYTRVKDAFNGETARRFFNLDYINRLLDDHKEGRQKNMKRIWSVYCFILWYDIYFTRDGVVA